MTATLALSCIEVSLAVRSTKELRAWLVEVASIAMKAFSISLAYSKRSNTSGRVIRFTYTLCRKSLIRVMHISLSEYLSSIVKASSSMGNSICIYDSTLPFHADTLPKDKISSLWLTIRIFFANFLQNLIKLVSSPVLSCSRSSPFTKIAASSNIVAKPGRMPPIPV